MAKPTTVCTQCHAVAKPQQASALVAWLGALLLGLFGIVFWPLLIVALLCILWPRPKRCPTCKAKNSFVPLSSPRGKQLAAVKPEGPH